MGCRLAIGAALVLVSSLVPTMSVSAEPAGAAVEDVARWVNPYTGTKPGDPDLGTGGGAGNTFPGADVPFGMVQWSPDTATHQHGGYFFDATDPARYLAKFSANALAVAGVQPGGSVAVDGISHTWPNVLVAEPDYVMVSGQTISASIPGATRLAFLGSATNGNASGTVTITYADGSTQTAQLGYSDWTLGGGGAPIAFDNRIAARMPYRNAVSGTPQTIVTYVFATAPITLAPGKQIASVTLPSTVDGGALHVFAVTAS